MSETRLERADTNFLWRALDLAGKGEGHTRPNPPVGAVIVRDGKIIGEGWHKRCGGDHAEVAAIKNAARRGCSTKGATIYVTLEPCSKPGRVGACTDAIIAAGIRRVVYAVADPNPKNRGKAKRALAKAGVECVKACKTVCDPVEWDSCGGLCSLIEETLRMLAPFAKHVATGMPYVTVKLAMSLDGKICDDWGDAKWISSAESRKVVGWERASVDAIMVGAETVRKDDPSLLSHNQRNDDLIRVVVTKSGNLPAKAQIFTDGAPNEVRVFRVDRVDRVDGVDRVVKVDGVDRVDRGDGGDGVDGGDRGDGGGEINSQDVLGAKDLRDVLRQLGERGVMHVLCEGGFTLARSLAEAGLVDRWISVVAPIVIGSRRIQDALRLKLYASGFSDVDAGDVINSYELADCRRLAKSAKR